MEETAVNRHSRGRRGHSRARAGRYNRTVHSVCEVPETEQQYQTQSNNSSVAAAHTVSHCSSTSYRSSPRGTHSRGRGNRRPWIARGTNRSVSAPIDRSVSDYSSTQQEEECSSPSRETPLGDANESLDVTTDQVVISNCGKNARRHERGRLVHGNRGRVSSRHPMSSQLCLKQSVGFNRAIHSASKEPENVQMSHSTNLSVTAADVSSSTVTGVSIYHSSSSLTSGAQRRGRGNRRPWRARGFIRSVSVPIDCVSECSSTQQEEECSLPSYEASIADANESLDVNTHQAGIILSVVKSNVVSNRGRNARQHGRGRFMRGNRGRLNYRQPVGLHSDSVSCQNSKATSEVSDSTPFDPFDSKMHDQLGASNAENEEYVDDDDDNDNDSDDDDDVKPKARNVPVTRRGNMTYRKVMAHRVRGNRRGYIRTGRIHDVLDGEDMSQDSINAESVAHSTPIEALVREAVTGDETSPASKNIARCQKRFKRRMLKVASSQQVREIKNKTPVPGVAIGGTEAAVKTLVASDAKPADIMQHGENISSNSSTKMSADDDSLFWHLVNHHHGKCCIDELRQQLNTFDADNAIAILRQSTRIKVLINESDKWKSVAFTFLKGLRMCLHAKVGCKKKNCSFLHVCPDYVTESCPRGEQCQFGHKIWTPANELCLQNCCIPKDCSSLSVLTIARSSNLIVCAGYNGVGGSLCHNPVQCVRVHVCNYFLCGHCLVSDSECDLGHQITSQHNARLLPLYEVQHLLKPDKLKTLHAMILPFNIDAHAHSPTYMSSETISEALQMKATRRTNKPHISDFVAVTRPFGTRVQHQMVEHEMKDLPCSLLSDEMFATSAIEPTNIYQSNPPVALRRFAPIPYLPSKADSVSSKLTEDKQNVCPGSVSTEELNTAEITASKQPSEVSITGDMVCQLFSDNDVPNVHLEVNETSPLNPVPRFASRRSQPAKTLEFSANQCQTYIKHLCNESNECSVRHDSLPYLWRVQNDGKWVAFEDSVAIEQAYCNPDNSTYTASFKVCIRLYNNANYIIIFHSLLEKVL